MSAYINYVDLDASPVYYSNQTDRSTSTTKSDNEKTNINNETKPMSALNQTIGNLTELEHSNKMHQ